MRSYTVWAVIRLRYDGFCDVANRPHITCMRNPAIGHEAEYDLNKAEASKKVWVIGGGVAGMEAAKILHERGHEVTLFEATNQWEENSFLQERRLEKLR